MQPGLRLSWRRGYVRPSLISGLRVSRGEIAAHPMADPDPLWLSRDDAKSGNVSRASGNMPHYAQVDSHFNTAFSL